jgi:hypothetical protein
MNFFKKVTKERLELKTSYLIRQVLTNCLEKHIVMFRRRIGGVVVVEDGLGEHAPKKLFSHKKKISLLDDNKG